LSAKNEKEKKNIKMAQIITNRKRRRTAKNEETEKFYFHFLFIG